MSSAPAPPVARPPVRRPLEGRALAGVAAGLAEHLGLHANAVRVAFVVATMAGGAGVIAYAFGWALIPEEVGVEPAGSARRARRVPEWVAWTLVAGAGLLALGLALLLRGQGVDVRLDLWVPLAVVATGAAFAWSQLDEATRRRWVPQEGPERGRTLTRLGIGVGLAVLGLLTLTAQGRGLGELWDVASAVLVVLAGLTVIAAPYAMRLWRDLRAEQVERVRATERADIAAHLHDSVLQTLTLIQRRSEDPAQVSRLARAQERELRRWLYAGQPGAGSTLASAVTEVGHEVEDLHGVPIELVVTGDHPLGPHGGALVRALREALVNAARHGAPPISAYVEVGQGRVEAFVRDHGPGFDPEAVPPDRLGVSESIVGRMARHGGSARVRRLEDGTEVSLAVALDAVPVDGAPDAVPAAPDAAPAAADLRPVPDQPGSRP